MNPNIDAFNGDVARNGGYAYTTNQRLSSQLAINRVTEAILAMVDLRGKEVLDIGCGDGTATIDFYDRAGLARAVGIDPAERAIDAARRKAGPRRVTFTVASACALPYENDRLDCACLRHVLHHVDRPVAALQEALRVARQIIVVEPNGYNPVLRVLEKCSSYHRAHDEKSYAPFRLDRWARKLGALIEQRQWVGLVPMFCPDWFARTLKALEPAVEKMPLVRAITCGVYVFVASRQGSPQSSREPDAKDRVRALAG